MNAPVRLVFLLHVGTLVPGGEENSFSPNSQSSPVQDPNLLATGQGCSELVSFIDHGGFSELLPGEVPLFLATLGDGVAVDSGPQVGVDRVIIGAIHPIGEKFRDQLLALRNPSGAGGADGVNLVVLVHELFWALSPVLGDILEMVEEGRDLLLQVFLGEKKRWVASKGRFKPDLPGAPRSLRCGCSKG